MVASPSPSSFFCCELVAVSQSGLFLRCAIIVVAFATAVEEVGATRAFTDAVWTAA